MAAVLSALGLAPALRRGAAGALALALALLAAPAARAQNVAAVHVDPAWLRIDSAATTVEFTLSAGLNGTNGGMNFNGASNGALTLTVPVGWHVMLRFKNQDQNMPHSAEVIRAVEPVPVSPTPPAFARAATHRLEQGMASDSHEDIRFVADQAGSYLVFCAVPGHGAAGMWIKLEVSSTATRPAIAASGTSGG